MQNMFTVMPMEQKITLDPGKVYHGSITIANPVAATEDFYYKVSVSPYSVSGTDYTPDFQTMSDWSRIVEWMELETTEGVLKPDETKKINFTITVPSDALAGGQYAMIGVRSDNPANSADSGVVQNIVEMASLLFADVSGEVVRSGEIIKNYVPGFVTNGEVATEVAFTNTGNIHETATTTISVKNVMTGESILPTESQNGVYDTVVMPDSTRILTRSIDGMAVLGIYEIRQDINYLGEESSVSTMMIVCPIWFIALIILTICSIAGMIFYAHFLRNRKSLKKSENTVDF